LCAQPCHGTLLRSTWKSQGLCTSGDVLGDYQTSSGYTYEFPYTYFMALNCAGTCNICGDNITP
jgi:hypothetical protein